MLNLKGCHALFEMVILVQDENNSHQLEPKI